MKGSIIVAAVLLALIAVLHILRIVFGVSIAIGGGEVPMVVSVGAAIIFGAAAIYLWKDNAPKES